MTDLPGSPAPRPIRWGILSTARIARQRVVPAIGKSPSSIVTAVASRSIESARAFAEPLGIPRAYGSYEELFADPEIDVIYNALPNSLHLETTLQALAHGKHVLVEKPIGMSRAEAEVIKAAAGSLLVAEAFMIRHHPQWHRTIGEIAAGEIGELRAVQTFFSFLNVDPANIRNRPELGGGAMLDIGCYAVAAARLIFGAEPERVLALIDRDPGMGTDRSDTIIADFGGGRQFSAMLSTQSFRHQHVSIIGTTGRLELPTPFSAPTDTECWLGIDRTGPGTPLDILAVPPVDQYALQAEAFSRAVAGTGPWRFGIDDAIANMAVIDALFRSERSGGWERP